MGQVSPPEEIGGSAALSRSLISSAPRLRPSSVSRPSDPPRAAELLLSFSLVLFSRSLPPTLFSFLPVHMVSFTSATLAVLGLAACASAAPKPAAIRAVRPERREIEPRRAKIVPKVMIVSMVSCSRCSA